MTIPLIETPEAREAWVREQTECPHAYEVRAKKKSNGEPHYQKQCVNCGASGGPARKAEIGEANWPVAAYDLVLEEMSWQRKAELRAAVNERWREQESALWRQKYDAHLRSEKWKAIRLKVLARSRGICEGCYDRKAYDVHHLTYVRLGDEMLFDLAALCRQCHERIHGHEIGSGPVRERVL